MTQFAAIAGAGLQAGGQLYSAFEARRLARYNAKVERAEAESEALSLQNVAAQEERLALMLDDEITFTREVSAFEAARLDERLEREEGATIAAIGASGLAFEGSPQVVLDEQARQAEVARLTLSFREALQVRSLEEQKRQRQFAAESARFQAGERLRIGRQRGRTQEFVGEQVFRGGILSAGASAAKLATFLRGGSGNAGVARPRPAQGLGALPQ